MDDKQKSIFEEGQVLLFDKPVYWTSFDLVNKVRIIIRSTFGIKKIKVGTCRGTLDPLAKRIDDRFCTGKGKPGRSMIFRDLDKRNMFATIPSWRKQPPSFRSRDRKTDNRLPHRSYKLKKMVKKCPWLGFLGETEKQLSTDVFLLKLISGKRAYEICQERDRKKKLDPVYGFFFQRNRNYSLFENS
jgi:hypothetical protein